MARKKTIDDSYKFLNLGFKLYNPKDKKKALNDIVFRFLNRLQTMVEIDGLPETMPKFDVLRLLQTSGYIVVSEVNGEIYANIGGLGGIPNEYYMPTICIVTNPYLKYNKELTIQNDKDAVLVKHDSYFRGLLPLIEKYATLLLENELTIYNTIINMRAQDFISAPDSNTAKSAQLYLDKLNDGDSIVVAENSFLDGVKVQARSMGQANTITQLLEMENYLFSMLFQELGLRDTHNMKRAYISEQENTSADNTLLPLIDDILLNLQDGFNRVNKKYGTNIQVRLAGAWEVQKEDIKNPPEEEPETTPEEKGEKEENG